MPVPRGRGRGAAKKQEVTNPIDAGEAIATRTRRRRAAAAAVAALPNNNNQVKEERNQKAAPGDEKKVVVKAEKKRAAEKEGVEEKKMNDSGSGGVRSNGKAEEEGSTAPLPEKVCSLFSKLKMGSFLFVAVIRKCC